jgi:hypothetical protein
MLARWLKDARKVQKLQESTLDRAPKSAEESWAPVLRVRTQIYALSISASTPPVHALFVYASMSECMHACIHTRVHLCAYA